MSFAEEWYLLEALELRPEDKGFSCLDRLELKDVMELMDVKESVEFLLSCLYFFVA